MRFSAFWAPQGAGCNCNPDGASTESCKYMSQGVKICGNQNPLLSLPMKKKKLKFFSAQIPRVTVSKFFPVDTLRIQAKIMVESDPGPSKI